MAKVKVVAQHVTESNEVYWDEVEVASTQVNDKGIYIGKPLAGTSKNKDKREHGG